MVTSIHKHIVRRLAQHSDKAEAGMADRVQDRALGGLRGVAPVKIDAYAHLGDAAHACHL
jgi:hypothetical protein